MVTASVKAVLIWDSIVFSVGDIVEIVYDTSDEHTYREGFDYNKKYIGRINEILSNSIVLDCSDKYDSKRLNLSVNKITHVRLFT